MQDLSDDLENVEETRAWAMLRGESIKLRGLKEGTEGENLLGFFDGAFHCMAWG